MEVSDESGKTDNDVTDPSDSAEIFERLLVKDGNQNVLHQGVGVQ